jgi:hypothetical protein
LAKLFKSFLVNSAIISGVAFAGTRRSVFTEPVLANQLAGIHYAVRVKLPAQGLDRRNPELSLLFN